MPTASRGIEVRASEAVRGAIASLGRTEDLRFSPNNRLLAIAGFARNRCLLLHVELTQSNGEIVITLDDWMELTSPALRDPHGLDFIDDTAIVFANRGGGVCILGLPPGAPAGRQVTVEPLRDIPGRRLLSTIWTPGSVAAHQNSEGLVTLLVCNNYARRVTRLVLDPARQYRTVRNHVLLRRGLDIPDGIVVSNDGGWIAVSSHATHDVKLYSNDDDLGPDSEPAGTLAVDGYPHGLQFTPDDRYLLVADAGSKFVKIYERGAGWHGEHLRSHAIEVLDDDTFMRGRHNPEEGGPKGLAFDRTGRIVAITNEEQPLSFHTLPSLLHPNA